MRTWNRSALGLVSTLALAVASLIGFAPSAHAQAGFYPKRVPLTFVRTSTAADNPLFGTLGVGVYQTAVANGTHGTATAGIAAVNPSLTDTSMAIYVGDHWAKMVSVLRQFPGIVANLLSDSTVALGTLSLTGLSSTIDTVILLRDVSADGITWTIVDSLGAHIVSATAQVVTGAVSDSAEFIMPSISNINGAVATKLALTFPANPWFTASGVTAVAIGTGVNWIRLRLHMTSGDYAAAGASRGITGEFIYPAVDWNVNQPGRYSGTN